MRRINIRQKDKLVTISCMDKTDLFRELQSNKFFVGVNLDLSNFSKFANELWDLNVGKSIICWGYTFSINSKRRVANQMYDGSTIGAKNDNN
jgi:hypothetical protein